jgi:hypothetical protein
VLQPSTTERVVYFDRPRPEDLADDNGVLSAMGEPPFCSPSANLQAGSTRFRFLWQRSFHPVVVAGLEVTATGIGTGFLKEAEGVSPSQVTGTTNGSGTLLVHRALDGTRTIVWHWLRKPAFWRAERRHVV